ncbi:MAG: hypothetical protein NC079_06585 [Clostridium sp.]|nr:hypothetical protein [Acetatifactor muris]MCM1526943.1 hypothetical protein [Bacteroides sp.]MCM1563263.1 hypothetical protein [Clostridium sp.]
MKVFIACPVSAVSGGAELLHQFSRSLTMRDVENYMLYYGNTEGCPTPERYKKYNVKIAEQYEDSEDSVLVLPEVGVHEAQRCQKGKVAIWWLSVNNYIMCYRQKFTTTFDVFGVARQKNVLQFVQSQYAKDFLEKFFKIEESYFLSDYINEEILEYARKNNRMPRQNICLYNPAKGLANVEPLVESSREDITWIPLQGYTPAEMADLMCRAKLYIDFGGHPGKDRIPREAAACGCCVITNREGSAQNDRDVPIDPTYKIGDVSDIPQVLDRIYDVMDHYEDRIKDFETYRGRIAGEKTQFEREVDEFLERVGGT